MIDQFVIDFDSIAKKKTTTLRSWLQNQANKFLHKFHLERKDKLILALDSECWKQADIPNDIQNLTDHILTNGLVSITNFKNSDFRSRTNDYIIINSEKYLVFG